MNEEICGKTETTNDGNNTDYKCWTSYYRELYKFSSSDEYISMIETCIHKKPEDVFMIFGKIVDFVTCCVRKSKSH